MYFYSAPPIQFLFGVDMLEYLAGSRRDFGHYAHQLRLAGVINRVARPCQRHRKCREHRELRRKRLGRGDADSGPARVGSTTSASRAIELSG
jgi:hypothetical protein